MIMSPEEVESLREITLKMIVETKESHYSFDKIPYKLAQEVFDRCIPKFTIYFPRHQEGDSIRFLNQFQGANLWRANFSDFPIDVKSLARFLEQQPQLRELHFPSSIFLKAPGLCDHELVELKKPLEDILVRHKNLIAVDFGDYFFDLSYCGLRGSVLQTEKGKFLYGIKLEKLSITWHGRDPPDFATRLFSPPTSETLKSLELVNLGSLEATPSSLTNLKRLESMILTVEECEKVLPFLSKLTTLTSLSFTCKARDGIFDSYTLRARAVTKNPVKPKTLEQLVEGLVNLERLTLHLDFSKYTKRQFQDVFRSRVGKPLEYLDITYCRLTLFHLVDLPVKKVQYYPYYEFEPTFEVIQEICREERVSVRQTNGLY